MNALAQRPLDLDDLDIEARLITVSIAAQRFGRARRTVLRWVAAGHIEPIACLIAGHAHLYRETDIVHAERASREARNTHLRRGAA